MRLSEDYPMKPPLCNFPSNFFHPNVYKSGEICISILSSQDGDWRPSVTVRQVLLVIQDLLDHPNPDSPAHPDSCCLLITNPQEYKNQNGSNLPISISEWEQLVNPITGPTPWQS